MHPTLCLSMDIIITAFFYRAPAAAAAAALFAGFISSNRLFFPRAPLVCPSQAARLGTLTPLGNEHSRTNSRQQLQGQRFVRWEQSRWATNVVVSVGQAAVTDGFTT